MTTPPRRSRRVASRSAHIESRSARLSQLSDYEYEPLSHADSIRVLELAPASAGKDQLSCRLRPVQMGQAEDTYEAISYVWGTPADGYEPIVCDGKRLRVTANLADGLYALRDAERPRVLWADAICINQKDDEEKSAQVRQMDKIFRSARQVLIWLGKDLVFCARDCFHLIQKTTGFLAALLEKHSEVNAMPLITASDISADWSQWEEVAILTKMHWFDRLWVIQEVSVAKKAVLIRGDEQMNYAHICELAVWVASRADISALVGDINTGEICDSFRIAHSTYSFDTTWTKELPPALFSQQSSGTGDFLAVLALGRGKLVTLPVDRVYGFLGHPYAQKLVIPIDYRKSADDVYFETACALLKDPAEAPYLLFFAGYDWWEHLPEFGERPRLPSWVPCWDLPWRNYYSMNDKSLWYAAGGKDRRFEAAVHNDKSLSTRGIIFDELVWVSGILEATNLKMEAQGWDRAVKEAGRPFIDTLWDQARESVQAHHSSETLSSPAETLGDEAFGLTMVQGYPWDVSYKEDIDGHDALFEIYRRQMREIARRFAEDDQGPVDFPVDDGIWTEEGFMGPRDFSFAAEYGNNHRLAITRRLRYALVPKHAKAGHWCCICPGVSKPLILEQRDNRRYVLVGDAYVNGAMEGEIIQYWIDGGLKMEDITIE